MFLVLTNNLFPNLYEFKNLKKGITKLLLLILYAKYFFEIIINNYYKILI